MDLSVRRDSSKSTRLRARARARRYASALVLLVPALLVLCFDVSLRSERLKEFGAFHRFTYSTALVESFFLWAVLLVAASRRRGRLRWIAQLCFVFLFTIAIGGQSYFFQQYNTYLNLDVSRFATHFVESVLNQLWADAGNYLAIKGPIFLLALGLLFVAQRVLRPTQSWALWCARLSPLVVLASLFIPTQFRQHQASTPDVLYLHAMGGMLRTQLGFTEQSHQVRPRARQSSPITLESPRRERRPNIVFVLLESARADATCVDFEPECQRTGATNQLFPERIPLRQMRSLASSTAISVAVLWSGLSPHESREDLHTWPLLFDYAKASGYFTAYWTSQNMMFGNVRLWVQNLGVDSFLHATDVDPTSDIDLGAPEKLFTERSIQKLGELREPYFLTIQLSNGHYPYLVDPDEPAPFQPAKANKGPEETAAFFNYYQNALHQQDRHLARLLHAIRRAPGGERTIVVYTSDHGEAFREHNQLGHTSSLYDEEIHVPAFIDVPPGLLSEEQLTRLREKSDAFTFHPDLTATMLEWMGVWDDPGIARYREKIVGQSLLAREANPRVLPLTNCSGVWSCAFENWGVIQGSRKLAARAWEKEYRCHDLLLDPRENEPLPPGSCEDLETKATELFSRLPGK